MDTTLDVPDMSCDGCVRRITKVLEKQGVDAPIVTLADRTVRLPYGPGPALDAARKALADAGYPATPRPG